MNHTQAPIDIEQKLGPIDRAFISIGSLESSIKKNPLKILGPVGLLLFSGYATLSPGMWRAVGGDWFGLALAPGRWIAMTATGQVAPWDKSILDLPRVVVSWPLSLPGKAIDWITGGFLGRMEALKTLRELTNETLLRYLYKDNRSVPPLEELIRDPDMSLFAPRLAGLTNLNMEKFLQLLPKDERNAFLKEWLKISDVDISRIGLERAILNKVGAADLVTVQELVRLENLSKFAPQLANIGKKEVLELLADRVDLRVQLAKGFLSLQERSVLAGELRDTLRHASFDQIEERIIGMLCRKMKYPPKLHELIARKDFQQAAPRLAGLTSKGWSWADVRKILSPDERMGDIPTWETVYGNPLGFISSIFIPWQIIETIAHGDTLPASLQNSATLQTGLMIGPPAIQAITGVLPEAWQWLCKATDPELDSEQGGAAELQEIVHQMQDAETTK